jgi:hypothetical protein
LGDIIVISETMKSTAVNCPVCEVILLLLNTRDFEKNEIEEDT